MLSRADQRIYVQIPAYRDKELLFTLEDLLRTAASPGRLRIGVAWQYGPGDEGGETALRRLPHVEIIKIPASRSLGCNWARSLLQARAGDEPYTLMLDSHHRFVPGWDEMAIGILEDLRSAGFARPVLTGYLPPYIPQTDPVGRIRAIYRMAEAERVDGLLFRLVGHPVSRTEAQGPFPASFASLHFLFADASFIRDVEADPAVYFFADEVSVGLRAFTHGYDLFHPHLVLGWHLYDRASRVPHWQDHPDWPRLNRASCDQLRRLYRGELRGARFGTGTARSVADFERRAGLRLIQPVAAPAEHDLVLPTGGG